MAYLHIGSYGPQHDCHGNGVVTVGLDPGTGSLSEPVHSVLTDSPGYLALSPSRRTVFAVHLVDDGKITALRHGPDGRLRVLGSVSTAGKLPCHVLIQRHQLVVCNFDSGSVAVVPLAADESIGGSAKVLELNGPQQASHPHGAWDLPFHAGQIVVSDLGLDTLTVFETSPSGLTKPSISAAPAGAGPRHIVQTASGDVFVSDELASGVSRYRYDQAMRQFRLVASEPSTRIAGANYPSDITASADACRVYVLNRGSDTISVFDSSSGGLRMLAEVEAGGQWPLHCLLLAGRLYVAALRSDRVIVHRLDERTGIPAGEMHHIDLASPACLLQVPP
jgi:6-phosphogluconolactonase